jgi:hypothetical protein
VGSRLRIGWRFELKKPSRELRAADHIGIGQARAKRAIRPLATGRSNWPQIGGDGGLKTASVLLSACASAGRHCLNPWSYLRDVLDQLATRSTGDKVGDLLPDVWASGHARMS